MFQAPGGLLLIYLNRQNFAKSACKTTKFCNFAKERNLNDEELMNGHHRIRLFQKITNNRRDLNRQNFAKNDSLIDKILQFGGER